MANVKGSAIVLAVRVLRSHREAARALLPESLHHYLEERIQVATWYPEEDGLEMIRALAKITGGGANDVFENMGRITAREHRESVYSHLLVGDKDPLALARRGFAIWASQHDSGKLDVTLVAPGEARIEVREYEHPSTEMCEILTGYFCEWFTLTGLAEARLIKTRCCLRQDDCCSWDARWRVD